MIKKLSSYLFALLAVSLVASALPANAEFYELKIYHCKNEAQVSQTDVYLKNAYLPALHRFGIKNIGVFKPLSNDTSSVKYIYVLIPFASQMQWSQLDDKLNKDEVYKKAAKDFTNASANNAPFDRIETILMQAFAGQQHLLLPAGKDTSRIYELRSYESPTENLFIKKMAMFNADEITIFNRLGFNPVFYGKVVSGSHMPNLMYMPVFTSVQQRDEQWKTFGNDARWKKISADPANENKVSVSHIDSIIMHAADYSDY